MVVVIGGGPAGLMAAEVLAEAGLTVDVYEAMPTLGRKFLMAGRGGLNITHAEPFSVFLQRYGQRSALLQPALEAFGPDQIRQWMLQLGINSFTGTSGRVFPKAMKSAPLLRAWIHRLKQQGVRFHVRHRWLGWDQQDNLIFQTPGGTCRVRTQATILALGGASWPQLGADAAWLDSLTARDIAIQALEPSNCGFDCSWSTHLSSRYAGLPLKSIVLRFTDTAGYEHARRGELLVTATGVEGSLIYGFSAALRDLIKQQGQALIYLDLLPDISTEQLSRILAQPRGSASMAKFLQRSLRISGIKAALLWECIEADQRNDLQRIAESLKALPLRLTSPRPLAEAISTAGGVRFDGLDESFMVRHLPGLFVAGEMLDWEAPTGGYLLTACFATARTAAFGATLWLAQQGQANAEN